MSVPRLPENFQDRLDIPNAPDRLAEAQKIADQITAAGVPLMTSPDHAAIFVDPPHVLAGPLKEIGYVAGWDARCYPSPVDGHDYINVSSGLPDGHAALSEGWFKYVAVVHPVDEAARSQMLAQGYGNPFIHHLTWGIVPPERKAGQDDLDYAGSVIRYMLDMRSKIGDVIGDQPGTLIAALPRAATEHPSYAASVSDWFKGISEEDYQVEEMEGGGYLLQFFVLAGGRIEVALRVETAQTFNPKSVHKISEDEISTVQS
jgi:hypothetical protein